MYKPVTEVLFSIKDRAYLLAGGQDPFALMKAEIGTRNLQGEHIEYDHALPQHWLNNFVDFCKVEFPILTYNLIRRTTVWIYDDSHFGRPYTCCKEIREALNAFGNKVLSG